MKQKLSKRQKHPRRHTKHSQRELERRIFHLKTLYDVSREIGFLKDPQEIMKHMLMMVLGTFGASCGFMLLADLKKGKIEAVTQRGMDPKSMDVLSQAVESGYFQESKQEANIRFVHESGTSLKGRGQPLKRVLSSLKTRVWMPFDVNETIAGGIGLGDRLSGDLYSQDDLELLSTLANEGAVAIQQIQEKEQRANLMQLFSKHVSPEVAEALWQQREQFLDGGRPRPQKLIVTAMFTDLEGFSRVSEKLDPQVLMDWLNTYMESIARTAMEHGGVVDDYFGDGVKVNFGVPLPRTTDAEIRQDAVNAVNCALAMEQEMVRLNGLMMERSLPTLRMRVGIFTGPVVAGSLGSADRLKYTTLGDTVNTASRLESFDKDLVLPHLATSPCRILIGESTLRYLDDRFETQRVGEVALKGKETKITAYCVLGRNRETEESQVSR